MYFLQQKVISMPTETSKPTFMHYIDTPSYDMELTSKYCKTLLVQLFNKICSEVSPEEFIVLDTISCHQDLCQRDLAKLILKDRANTGRILDSLEKKGLVERSNDTKNNRLVRKVNITDCGIELLESLILRFKPYHDKMCKIFNDEDLLILSASLKKMRDSIAQLVEIQI